MPFCVREFHSSAEIIHINIGGARTWMSITIQINVILMEHACSIDVLLVKPAARTLIIIIAFCRRSSKDVQMKLPLLHSRAVK